MLAELVTEGGAIGGLGNIINIYRRRGVQEPIYLLLMIIPAVALAIDRTLFMMQRSLFPYQYGSYGLLHQMWRALMHAAADLKHLFVSPHPLDEKQKAAICSSRTPGPSGQATPPASA
jgi:hypothetical protein